MRRLLKTTAILAAVLLALLLAAIGLFVATFDPDAHKAWLIEQVQARTGRTLAVPGPVELRLFPTLGARVGAVALSAPRSAEPFAALRSAQVSVALWPLLRRQLVVDRIEIDGLDVQLVRNADGSTSIDDLLGTRASTPASAPTPSADGAASAVPVRPLQFDIAGIALTDTTLRLDDRAGPRRLTLSHASLRTGRVVPGLPVDLQFQGRLAGDAPQIDTTLQLQARVTATAALDRITLETVRAEVAGRVATLTGLQLRLSVPSATWAARSLQVPALELQADAGSLQLRSAGSAALDLARQRLDSTLAGRLDRSQFQAKLGLASFTPAAIRFDLEVDQIDLDRYRSPAPAAAAAASAPATETPLDLSALAALDARGAVRVGALQVAGLKTTALRTDLRAAGGRIELASLAAQLYGGRLSGRVGVQAAAVPRFALQAALTGVRVGPLLADLLAKPAPLEGVGDVVLDLATQGGSVAALPGALQGGARVVLRDGMVRGINVAQTLRRARAQLTGGDVQSGSASAAESTDFSALTASFRIRDGVARNDDLQASSPLLRVGGNGDIDIGRRTLDYLVQATVVATLEGQGGPELQALRGQTIPVRLQGPFDALRYRVEFGSMARDLAKQKLEPKAREALDKAKDDARQRLGDKLQDLLRK
ncbi:AsmA family protein [Rubrivivax sp. RP6-9]|uniref:AsmA family protein n=1 Tax=Rubrivivax sp. RP6-9 TaxID=3415750 RepID=UPI003CC66A66